MLALMSTLLLSSFSSLSAIAQDENCYLVTTSGQRIELNRLCGELPALNVSKDTLKSGGVARAKIKRRISAIPVIEVTFNGGRSFDMIVDTGASTTLITKGMADALQIQPARIVQAGIADGSIVQFPTGYVQSMAVDNVTARNVEVTIADRMDIGLLGHDFFGNFDVKIKQDVIEFYPRSRSGKLP